MSDVLSTPTMMHTFDHRLLTRHRFAIVDASHREGMPPHWRKHVIAPAFLKEDTQRCPVLVDLTSLTPDDHDQWLNRCADQLVAREPLPFSAYLQTSAEPDVVLAHLRQRLVMHLPQREQPLQFRFYDPHTLTQLPRVLGDRGLQWLLGPITTITYAIAGHLSRIDIPTNEMPRESTAAFKLSQEQQQALLRLSILNRVLVQLPSMNGEMQWRQVSLQVDRLILRAEQRGLIAMDDQIAFALHGLTVHARFDEHPTLRALFKQLRASTPEDELDYRELTAVFTPDQWQQIQHELDDATAATLRTPA